MAGLLAPLRLPERVLEALDELRPIRLELTRVRKQTEPLPGLLPALKRLEKALSNRLDAVQEVVTALESDQSHLNRSTQALAAKVEAVSDLLAPVDDRLATIERTIEGLAGEVGSIREPSSGSRTTFSAPPACGGSAGWWSAPATPSPAATKSRSGQDRKGLGPQRIQRSPLGARPRRGPRRAQLRVRRERRGGLSRR